MHLHVMHSGHKRDDVGIRFLWRRVESCTVLVSLNLNCGHGNYIVHQMIETPRSNDMYLLCFVCSTFCKLTISVILFYFLHLYFESIAVP
ncbi:hypothetical protein EXVG_00381 [Emiliania huxleyi virus 202]|nr:hypothetical protein EXVG_00381 [Emiliania huxleyi virus 202]